MAASTLEMLTMTEQAELLRAKRVSARELLEAVLHQVEQVNPAINAVVTLDAERAFAEAQRCDRLAARGEWLGSLHGLPCTIKDALDTQGIRTTGGAVELADRVPAVDACAVARARAAGAIVFGKTNLPRWSGDYQTSNEMFGTSNNPYDVSRVPGGSSGGAAAAVAAGMTSFEIGTDIGGSIRLPSSFCGIAGHKPTFGVVPQRGYVAHTGGGTELSDINVVGPMARSVGDLALLLDVLAGPDPHDSAWSLQLPEPKQPPWRIAAHLGDAAHPISAVVRAALAEAVDALAAEGAEISGDPAPVTLDEAAEIFLPLVGAAIALSAVDLSTPETRDGVGGTHVDWLRHDLRRIELRNRWASWFESNDVVLMPAWPTPAFPHSSVPLADRMLSIDGREVPMMSASAWLGYAGVVGLPSTVVRIGASSAGLPIGIQVVGPRFGDRTTLAVAQRLEQLLGGYQPPAI